MAAELVGRSPRQLPDTEEPVVVLNPFVVREEPITSFGIALRIEADPTTQLITSLVVIEVPPRSEVWNRAIRKGAEILAVEGKDVRSIAARFDPGSEFNRYFMNRKAGDRLKLTVVSAHGDKPRVVELVQRSRSNHPPWELSDFP